MMQKTERKAYWDPYFWSQQSKVKMLKAGWMEILTVDDNQVASTHLGFYEVGFINPNEESITFYRANNNEV